MEFQAFSDQVAGSFPLLRREDGHLCKPATSNELKFYEFFRGERPNIAKFVPNFLGKIAVATNVVYKANNHNEDSGSTKHVNTLKKLRQKARLNALPVAFSTRSSTRKRKLTESKDFPVSDVDLERSPRIWPTKRQKKAPWSFSRLVRKLGEQRSAKVLRENSASEDEDPDYVCLVLENLTDNFRLPHVLDLKIGTRQHGSHESEAKKRSKTLKCKTTTSATLGIRIGGMQIFDAEGRRINKDKYWGRSLTPDTLKEALTTFVTYPTKNTTDQILRGNTGEKVDSEDGDLSDREAKKQEEKRAIQNGIIAHAHPDPEVNYSRTNSQASQMSLTASTAIAPSSSSIEVSPVKTSRNRVRTEIVKSIVSQADELIRAVKKLNWRFYGCSALITFSGATSKTSLRDNRDYHQDDTPETDVKLRIIDFANAEMEGHTGYDKGFVFGLENLKEIFASTLENT